MKTLYLLKKANEENRTSKIMFAAESRELLVNWVKVFYPNAQVDRLAQHQTNVVQAGLVQLVIETLPLIDDSAISIGQDDALLKQAEGEFNDAMQHLEFMKRVANK